MRLYFSVMPELFGSYNGWSESKTNYIMTWNNAWLGAQLMIDCKLFLISLPTSVTVYGIGLMHVSWWGILYFSFHFLFLFPCVLFLYPSIFFKKDAEMKAGPWSPAAQDAAVMNKQYSAKYFWIKFIIWDLSKSSPRLAEGSLKELLFFLQFTSLPGQCWLKHW